MARIRSFTVLPALPDSLKDLELIAKNMYWCWNPQLRDLFKRIDSELWTACGHNPVKLLGSVPQQRFEELTQNTGFVSELNRALEKLNEYREIPTWYSKHNSCEQKPVIVYFSAEFGIHESLPIYSGGLGGLAGDHLKSASDLGIPLVGVGLMYKKGYFRQYLNIDGWQQELYVENDLAQMPLELVRGDDGNPLMIMVEYPGRNVYAQIWRVNVGRVQLLLLDTNVHVNTSSDCLITANLYGGDREMRIRQEIMLGIGGLRALNAMGIQPCVCHMNEGHAGFMALERIRQLCISEDMTFEQALEATKAGNVFTIHTPVKAGLDEFTTELMDKYFCNYYPSLKMSRDRFLQLGRVLTDNDTEPFKMPVLALKLSAYRNGVSELHGVVSREMWAGLWKNVPISEVPVSSVTNGVHTKTWLCDELNLLYERYFGPNWTEDLIDHSDFKKVEQIPDEEIWRAHQRSKGDLIAFARRRLKKQMKRRGSYHSELNQAEEVLDPEALTIGFARRFATYKRGNLLLKDPQRLIKLLTDRERPIQIIFAGKAHPRDNEGKEIIRQIIHFAAKNNVRRRIVFLEDYDINVARNLVQGVDVWLNTPRRPMEASGTSGMKASINGALNFSILDGWWCEGFDPQLGWAIGAGENYDDPVYQNMVESQAIYNILENEIIPLFYTKANDGLPRAWIYRMKKALRYITPKFNTHRMVIDYTRRFYNPASEKWLYLNADNRQKAKDLAEWIQNMRNSWTQIDIEDVQMNVLDKQTSEQFNEKTTQLKVGAELDVRALVNLSSVNPEDVSVQIYHGAVDSWGNIDDGQVVTMTSDHAGDAPGHYWFKGIVRCFQTGQQGLAVRVLPANPDLTNQFDLGMILWESTARSGSLVAG